MRLDRLEQILERAASRRITVIGDLMLDEFVWGKVGRISPEAPVPVLLLKRRQSMLGGAGNVARNIAALGGTAILMGIICAVLLVITGAGIIGLTSFWVGQRRKQIGIRRALGATRRDILRYFQTENLLIAGVGVAMGAVLAVGLNLWMMRQLAMDRLPLLYVLAGVVALLLLGQGAVFAPARRASRVSPVEATRSV